ncbi:peptidase inhibitor family I36 protein [Cellulomonas edaphi]|uniref:Peptidase inhibitor family I36 protein n=1 Tax=Cellulomonas edaphi TaxID=3053468 RepID=A0ABT7S4R8_9CELL|nr:peptidase inhibitor family I36 protein [Cellulomons edaphi]MDM7830620.1 peptidase inhibitor family I36 protein [Cellulomons edaphi]
MIHLAASGMLVGALVVTAAATSTAAHADEDDDSVALVFSASACPDGRLCLWTVAPYAGVMVSTFSTAVYDTGLSTARSVSNRASTAARVYSGLDGTGTSRCYPPGTRVSATSVAARSFRILGTTEC